MDARMYLLISIPWYCGLVVRHLNVRPDKKHKAKNACVANFTL